MVGAPEVGPESIGDFFVIASDFLLMIYILVRGCVQMPIFNVATCRSLTQLTVPPSQEVQLLAGLHLRGSHEMFMCAAVSSESSCTLFLAEVY